MARHRNDYDSPWKEIIEQFFPSFIAFFLPVAYSEIDWNTPYEFLDKELQRAVRRSTTGRRTVDKLVKVRRIDGRDAWVLVHIEVQSQAEQNFARRMYVLNSRIFDRFSEQVVSLAVLGDEHPDWRPKSYEYELWGFGVAIRFPIVKLLDYAVQWETLAQSDNPFAVVVMAHLKAKETQRNPQSRLRWKIALVKGMYDRGFTRKQVSELFRFIDWVLALPDKYEVQFEEAIKQIEEEQTMQYVTTIERRATRQGIEQGIEQGRLSSARDSVVEVLGLRFQPLPEDLIEQIMALTDLDFLKTLLRQATLAGSLEEFERAIDSDMK